MTRFRFALILTIFFLAGFAAASQASASARLDRLGIIVKKTPRQFVFTNKEAGTYYSEALTRNVGGWFGWYVNAEKVFHEYDVLVGGVRLNRASSVATVYPHQTVRRFKNGAVETFTMVDGLNALVVEIAGAKQPADVIVELPDHYTAERDAVPPYRSWRRSTTGVNPAVPTSIVCAPYPTSSGTVFVIAVSSSVAGAMRLADSVFTNRDALIAARRDRMETILRRAAITADDARLTTAFAWAVLSMDALIMRQAVNGVPTTGIFAGLPWFNNYWGRDSFIALPGATYVTGNFADAKEILRSYARFQELDSTSTNYGRIPNLATPTSVQYNTADGTPWFVKGVAGYVRASGDTAFFRELYPVVRRSIEGTLRYHTDSLMFLTHGDAETWMDAVGPAGPWSPRGTRANDVQALWHDQLANAAWIAMTVGDEKRGREWVNMAKTVSKNFNRAFLDTAHGLVYDHLTASGTPSRELRPNQLFCLSLLPDDSIRREITSTVLSRLVYKHGTGTLAQTDSGFTPWHHYEPYYVQDAAYHNGIVWTWLNGAAIRAAVRYSTPDVVYPVTTNMVHQILDRGCVGALSELLDAHPRTGEKEPRLSGTYSQAWSLAEFIRSMFEDYLGATVDASGKYITIAPKLPKAINDISFPLTTPDGMITVRYRNSKGVTYVSLRSDARASYTVTFIDTQTSGIVLQPRATLERSIAAQTSARPQRDLSLAMPKLEPYLRLLKGSSHPMLTLGVAGRTSPSAAVLFDKADSLGDDRGAAGTYTYPGSVHLKPGSLDITRAVVRHDKKFLYFTLTFRNLSDPGWHPEYGFQLTLAAVAIHRGARSTQTAVGTNSGATLAPANAYDRLLVVGGGYRLTDGAGNVLCEYRPRPEDAAHPIGSTHSKTIGFAVPIEYIGTPTEAWKMTILVGAQDDHGGAGVGEFRAVDERGGEWTGGGKTNAAMPNVYDTLVLERTNN